MEQYQNFSLNQKLVPRGTRGRERASDERT
jgi:hypothetical protein